ncbi:MAG: rhomboid family intramembrane serine protease [Flavobacteriales bacterium]|jgi:membrane associated rhomboid family serine protease|nr:rhomboid family intramembrane serine protease [Flavobacteriales bacterium]
MQDFRAQRFEVLPPVVKNLLIINGLMFLATVSLNISQGISLNSLLGLHYFLSPRFEPYQLVTYMFMHGSFSHLFFNMFALWMFGSAIENYWGGKRFLTYYLITGMGASVLHYIVVQFEIWQLSGGLSQEEIDYILITGSEILESGRNFADPVMGHLNQLFNTSLVGASGSLFGILLAFGMLFPDTLLFLIFIPIPIKAKYFVAMYGAIELFSGLQNNPTDNVAHFAHLGGMLFGFLLIKYWRKKSGNYWN